MPVNDKSFRLTSMNAITHTQQQQLAEYVQLLCKWNKAYNLISHTDPNTIKVRHIADSLSISPYLNGSSVLDVGTGAGLPGIPLAIAHPDKQFTLLDSRGKKTRFLMQVKQALGLKNVTIINERAESYTSPQCFANIIARAVADIKLLVQISQHLCCNEGEFLFMKGALPTSELLEVPLAKVIALHVPDLNEQRHLICLKCADIPTAWKPIK